MKPSDRRWEQGLPHHPLSEAIFELLADADREEDYFCWKHGGDGDNGETLMFLLDEHLDTQEADSPIYSRLANAVRNPKLPPADPVEQLDALGFGNIHQDSRRITSYTRSTEKALAALEWGWSIFKTRGGLFEASKALEE